jgi:8-oxo-dGTP diphosphatase
MKTYVAIVGVVKFRNKILIFKRKESKRFFPGLWEFPGGFIKERETAEEAVLREVEEETGLKGRIIRAGKSFETKGEGKRWIVIPFLISVKAKKVKISREHSEYRWIKPDEIDNFETVVDAKRDLKSLELL